METTLDLNGEKYIKCGAVCERCKRKYDMLELQKKASELERKVARLKYLLNQGFIFSSQAEVECTELINFSIELGNDLTYIRKKGDKVKWKQ